MRNRLCNAPDKAAFESHAKMNGAMYGMRVSDSEATDLRVPFESQPTGNSADVGANAHFYFLGNFAETGVVIVPPFPRIAAPTNLTQSRQQAKAVQGGSLVTL